MACNARILFLACLLEENPACRIALAPPTGKAAVRIIEAIRLRAAHLPERIRMLLSNKSSRVHRLPGVLPRNGFLHNAKNPLPIDILIVDEASMLDLSLATHLIEAVTLKARIVLVGDKDQLAAVEAGAVLARLRDVSNSSLAWFDDAGLKPSPQIIDALCGGYSCYVDACRIYLDDPHGLA